MEETTGGRKGGRTPLQGRTDMLCVHNNQHSKIKNMCPGGHQGISKCPQTHGT